MYFIGLDLGTSSLKALLIDENGVIVRSESEEYPLSFPHHGWSEQDPEDWWDACVKVIRLLVEGIDPEAIKGMGCGGQMHGLVILDENDHVIRPAILWNDGRTEEETAWLNETIGKEKLTELTANIAFAGFTAPKLLWLKKNEPDNFKRIKKIMLPKDYINYRLTGIHCTDYSDASGMLLLDVKHKCWSKEVLEICDVKEEQMPHLYESYEAVGILTEECVGLLGLSQKTIVAAGAGDNAAAAIGTGTLGEGSCNISLGTSGTIFLSSNEFRGDPQNALHAFAHADGHYHLMGCMLSAASCNAWFMQNILHSDDYEGIQAGIKADMLGRNSVYFLPYLMGERSPINDTDARALFIGMSMDTSRTDMIQAVLEGVTFAIRDSFEAAKKDGLSITSSKLCGGGAKSKLWRQMLADILNIRIEIPQSEEGPGYGGAMLAMTACGVYPDVSTCAEKLIHVKEIIEPDPETAARYEAQYRKYCMIYPAVKQVYKTLKSTE